MENSGNKAIVLIVEDSASTRATIKKILVGAGICDKVLEAENGLDAISCLAVHGVDLIICDILMPKMDGFKFLMVLNDSEAYKNIPVILLSGASEVSKKVKGFEIGAWDFISKPFEPAELIARAKNMLRIKMLQDSLQARMKELELLSIVDSLTGLYNKKYLYEYLEKEIAICKRNDNMIACIMIDIDLFKEINDTYGHVVADSILKEVGHIFSYCLRGYDFAARYGGDEFVVVMSAKDAHSIEIVCDRIKGVIEHYDFGYQIQSLKEVRLTVSLGTAIFPSADIHTAQALVNEADKGLYKAKAMGRNRIVHTGNLE